MLCRRCEHRAKLLQFWTSPASVWGPSRLGDLICVRCGAVLPVELVTERLLGKLSQLDQFGLASGAPLLERPGDGKQ